MKVCFPVKEAPSLDSQVFGHFGSAPAFVLIDTDTDELTAIENLDRHHGHGRCSPIRALGGTKVDAVVVGGIGRGALAKLAQEGIAVYQAAKGTVQDNLELFKAGQILKVHPGQTCSSHRNREGCAHS